MSLPRFRSGSPRGSERSLVGSVNRRYAALPRNSGDENDPSGRPILMAEEEEEEEEEEDHFQGEAHRLMVRPTRSDAPSSSSSSSSSSPTNAMSTERLRAAQTQSSSSAVDPERSLEAPPPQGQREGLRSRRNSLPDAEEQTQTQVRAIVDEEAEAESGRTQQQHHLATIPLSDNNADHQPTAATSQTEEDKETMSSPHADDHEQEQDADNTNREETEAEHAARADGMVEIRILDLKGTFFTIWCRLEWKVDVLKRLIFEKTEVEEQSQRLIYRGRVLEDDKDLNEYKVEDGHTIHLFVRRVPDPEPENQVDHANGEGARNENHFPDGSGMTVVHIASDTISSAVHPLDSARRVDPLMLDTPLGNSARRVKLWSSFLLIIYTMKVMGQVALLANDQQQRNNGEPLTEEEREFQERYQRYQRYEYPALFNQDPLVGAIELFIHAFGVYVGCVGFKAAHETDVRPIRFYCRGIVWLAVLTLAEQIFITIQISHSDLFKKDQDNATTTAPNPYTYPYGRPEPTLEDIVSANIFQTVMLFVMWVIAIHHSIEHLREVSRYNASFAAAAMNAMPPMNPAETV